MDFLDKLEKKALEKGGWYEYLFLLGMATMAIIAIFVIINVLLP